MEEEKISNVRRKNKKCETKEGERDKGKITEGRESRRKREEKK